MDMDRYIGRLLDNRYEILEVIGTGGMAVVYKARCHRLNRLVAIKILKDENLQDEDFRRRFHAESQAVAMLSHPNIVSVYDVSATENADYIVMELIDGITLKQYMEKKGVLNWKETLHFAIQIAKALEHAHSRGIVHRDIKPHNVMVLKNGSVKVADFGIARVMSKSNTLTKEALGSVHYISPEQAKGGRVDNRSDLYSLGIVMYEMITGRPPYDGESPVAVAIKHINGGAGKPSVLNPNIPAGLEQIIMKAMATDLSERYGSATDMLYDMDELRKDPALLFAFNPPNKDDGSTKVLHGVAEAGAAAAAAAAAAKKEKSGKTTAAQRNAAKAGGAAVAAAKKKQTNQQDRDDDDEGGSRVATIAIAVCSAVAIIAIVIFLIVMMGGSGDVRQIQIPGLVGQYFDKLPEYDGVVIVQQIPEYSSEYAKGQIIRQDPEGGSFKPAGTVVFVVVSLGEEPPESSMADLVGMDADRAEEYLVGRKLNLYIVRQEVHHDTVEAGKVIRTVPSEGEPLKEGDPVQLWISLGPKKMTAMMPSRPCVGMTMEAVERMLNANGFTNLEWIETYSDKPVGTVLSQSVEPGEVVETSTLILLEYSIGPDPEATTEPTDPPDDPTDPSDPTDPTEPEQPTDPTDPPGGDVTITYIFQLPTDRAEMYVLRIEMNGQVILPDIEILPDQMQLPMKLTGSGVQTCTLYIDGEEYATVEINFSANE